MNGTKKMAVTVAALCVFCAAMIAEDAIVSIDNFKQVYAQCLMNGMVYSPDDLYEVYERNAIQYEKNFAGRAFMVGGYVTKIRRGIMNEYIGELKLTGNPFYDLNVVYPSGISQAKINDLANLNIGDYFKAIVVGRNTDMYVDVLCYRLNGAIRTEP